MWEVENRQPGPEATIRQAAQNQVRSDVRVREGSCRPQPNLIRARLALSLPCLKLGHRSPMDHRVPVSLETLAWVTDRALTRLTHWLISTFVESLT